MTGQAWLLDAFLVTMQWSLNRKSTADHPPPTMLIIPSKKQMRDLVDSVYTLRLNNEHAREETWPYTPYGLGFGESSAFSSQGERMRTPG